MKENNNDERRKIRKIRKNKEEENIKIFRENIKIGMEIFNKEKEKREEGEER